MKQLLKGIVRSTPGKRISRSLFYLSMRANPELLQNISGAGGFYATQVPDEHARLMEAIPTETTWRERRLLYSYFADHWTGDGDVVEIGPFLGGTTAAIALGMGSNPRRRGDTRLITFDRFRSYHTKDNLRGLLKPLFENGRLSREDFESRGNQVEFLDIFEQIHAGTPYASLVEPRSAPVPDHASDQDGPRLKIERAVSAAFVDGCKSWYGTKYFMQQLAPHSAPGTPILFQDFACRTCFWITAFTELFRDKLRLFAFTDDTYGFLLTERITPEEIDARYPNEPEGFTAAEFNRLYDGLIERERSQGDTHGAAMHVLHKVGALAYIGEKDDARAILAQVDERLLDPHHRLLYRLSRRSPTYTPEADVTL